MIRVLSAPLDLCLGITNRCNLNCKHCLASSSRQIADLTTAKLLDIIREIKELKIFSVAIFGGEPLMRADFFSILEALCKLKIGIALNTNGTLITKKMARSLASYPIKSYTVSLDGATAAVHDPFRGKGSFKRVLEGIQNLISEKRRVLISTIVTQYNYNDIENIISLGRKLGAYGVRFNDVVYVGKAACYNKSLLLSPQKKFGILEMVKAQKQRWGSFVSGSIIQMEELIEAIKHGPKEKFPLQINSCGAGVTKCAIRPDGWVTPCEILWDVKAGNLLERSLYEIWHHSPVLATFRRTFEIREDQIQECKDCDYLRLCYKGHRCQPYYNPGERFGRKELYCWREDVPQ